MSDDLRDDLTDTDAEPTGYLRRAINAAESGDDREARVYLQRYARE